MPFCPECGSKVDEKDTFCPECGKQQEEERPISTGAKPQKTITPTPTPTPTKITSPSKPEPPKEIPKKVEPTPVPTKKAPIPTKAPPKPTPPDTIPPKGGFNWINAVLAGLLVLSLIAFGYTYDSSQSEIRQLKNQLNDVKNEIEDYQDRLSSTENQLKNTKSELSSTKQTLRTTQSQLETTQSELKKTRVELEDIKDKLVATQISLIETEQTLTETESKLSVEQILRIGNLLQDHYNEIRENEYPQDVFLWWKSDTTDWNKQSEFATDLARHDLSRIKWAKECDLYHTQAGDKYCYYEAKSKLDAVLELAGVRSSDSDALKIEKILKWVTGNIPYEHDMNEIFRAPVETLGLKSGDCDDYSILAGALFENADIDSAVGFFRATDESFGHAMVLVRLDDLGGHPNRYYDDLTPYGLSAGKWIKIEPQKTIDEQSGDWVKKWNLVAASEIQ